MKTNYESILERILLVASKAHTIRATSKAENVKKELEIYKTLVKFALTEKKKVIEKNPEIKKIEDQINILIKYKKLASTAENFKEGLGINKHLYRLINTNNIDLFNNSLLMIIDVLDTVSVNFKESDFKITNHVNKYMKAFYKHYKSDNYVKEMKYVYDGLVWEHPELKEEIVLNLKRNLRKVSSKVQSDMEKTAFGYMKKYNIDKNNIDEQIITLLKKEQSLKEVDKHSIRVNIQKKKLNIKNYVGETNIISKAIETFINTADYVNMVADVRNNFEDNISKLLFNIDEYMTFNKFSFLVDDVMELKNTNVDLKEIKNFEKNYAKLTAKKSVLDLKVKKLEVDKEKLLNKTCRTLNSEEKRLDNLTNINKQIKAYKSEIRKIVKEKVEKERNLSDSKFILTIKEIITDKSTLFDVLRLFSNNHIQLLNSIKKHKECTLNEEEALMFELKKLLGSPKINFTKNILIANSKSYDQIMQDEAKKLNLNLNLENLDELNNIKNNARIVHQYKNLKRSNLNLNEIEEFLN